MGQKAPLARINLSNCPKNPAWYTVVTKFNYEKKFASDLLLGLKGNLLEDYILDVVVPIKENLITTITRTGKEVKKVKEDKVYPLYVFVKAIMNERVWDYMRTTNGAQTVLATSGEPNIVSEDDIIRIKDACGLLEKDRIARRANFNGYVGDTVEIIDGPFSTYKGIVEVINISKNEIQIRLENGLPVKVGAECIEVI